MGGPWRVTSSQIQFGRESNMLQTPRLQVFLCLVFFFFFFHFFLPFSYLTFSQSFGFTFAVFPCQKYIFFLNTSKNEKKIQLLLFFSLCFFFRFVLFSFFFAFCVFFVLFVCLFVCLLLFFGRGVNGQFFE